MRENPGEWKKRLIAVVLCCALLIGLVPHGSLSMALEGEEGGDTPPAETTPVLFTITVKSGDEPVAGASVALGVAGATGEEQPVELIGTTGDNGVATVDVTALALDESGRGFSYTVSAAGYDEASGSGNMSASNLSLEIQMTETVVMPATLTVIGVVKEETEGGAVAQGNVTVTATDSDGAPLSSGEGSLSTAIDPDTGAFSLSDLPADGSAAKIKIESDYPGYSDGTMEVELSSYTPDGENKVDLGTKTFLLKTFEIAFQANGLGAFSNENGSPLAIPVSAKYGENVTFKFEPNSGVGCEVKDGETVLTTNEGVYTIANIREEHGPVTAERNDDAYRLLKTLTFPEGWTNAYKIGFEAAAGAKLYISGNDYETADAFHAVDAEKAEVTSGGEAVTANGIYYLYATDAEGHFAKGAEALVVNTIDKTAPVADDVMVLAYTYAGETHYVVRVSSGNESPIESVTVSAADKTVTMGETVKEAEQTTVTFSIEGEAAELVLTVEDDAGNSAADIALAPYSDTAADGYTVIQVICEDEKTWSQEKEVSFTAAPAGAVTEANYKLDDGEEQTLTAAENTYRFRVQKNGRYTICVKTGALDLLIPMDVDKIDVDKPQVEVTEKPDEGWQTRNITVKITATDGHSGVKAVKYKLGEGGEQEAVYDSGSGAYSFTISDDMVATSCTVWAEDNVGLESEKRAFLVKRDATAPSIENPRYSLKETSGFFAILHNITGGLLFKDKLSFSFSAMDVTSGVAQYAYQIVENPEDGTAAEPQGPESGVVWHDYAPENDCITIEESLDGKDKGFTGKIYLWVKDTAGNVGGAELVKGEKDGNVFDILVLDRSNAVTAPEVVFDATQSGKKLTDEAVLGALVDNSADAAEEKLVYNTEKAAVSPWLQKLEIKLGDTTVGGVQGYEYEIVYADASKNPEIPAVSPPDAPPEVEEDNENQPSEEEPGGTVERGSVILVVQDTTGEQKQKWDGVTILKDKLVFEENTNAVIRVRAISNYQALDGEGQPIEGSHIRGAWSQPIYVKVQKDKPQNGTAPNRNGWSRGGVTIKVTPAEEAPFCAPITTFYRVDNTTTEIKRDSESGRLLPVDVRVSGDGTHTMTVWTLDAAGNRSEETINNTVRIDGSAPTGLDISIDGRSIVSNGDAVTFQTFYSEEVVVRLSASDATSGVRDLQYMKVRTPDAYHTGTWMTYNSSTGIIIPPSDQFVIYFRAGDSAGNSTEVHSIGIVVDDKEPSGEQSYPEIDILPVAANPLGYYTKDVNVDLKVIDPAFVGAQKNENGAYSGLKQIAYRIFAEDIDETEEGVLFDSEGQRDGAVFDGDGLAKSWTGKIIIEAEKFNSNNVVVELTATDNAGNTHTSRTGNQQIRLDSAAPTDLNISVGDVSVLGNETVHFETFYKETVTLRLTAADSTSGVAYMEYQKVSDMEEFDAEGDWNDYSAEIGLAVTPNERFILFFRATDAAGNATIANSVGIVVDNRAPAGEKSEDEMDILPAQPNENGCYAGDVSVELRVEERAYAGTAPSEGGAYAGVRSVSYRVYAQDIGTEEEGVLFDPEAGMDKGAERDRFDLVRAWKGSINIDAQKFNSNQVVVALTATDNAGNTRTTETELGALKIDVTPPTLRITSNNNTPQPGGKYYNAPRVVTVAVSERNFAREDIEARILRDNGAEMTLSAWTTTPTGGGNGDGTVHTAQVEFQSDGDYSFEIAYTDLAGNAASVIDYSGMADREDFTIDQTMPSVDVTFSGGAAGEAGTRYYNTAQTVTISVTEHNFDENRVEIIQGSVQGVVSGWSHNGDIHTSVVNCGTDGVYDLTVNMTDQAGNPAAEQRVEEFTIDRTAPEITFAEGLEEGTVTYGETTPFSLGMDLADTNADGYTWSLLQVRPQDSVMRFEGRTQEQEINRELDEYFKVEKNAEKDGIYVLTVTARDKAGNETEREASFTVNRCGSVCYVGDQRLEEYFNNKFMGTEELARELVIMEYSPSPFAGKAPQLTLTQQGMGQSKVDGQLNNRDQERLWSECRYTISPEMIDQTTGATYEIAILSDDAAKENSKRNSHSAKFTIDTTAPEIQSITGLESAAINAQEVVVTYTVRDASGLGRVEIYVDGALYGSVVEDFGADISTYTGSFTLQAKNSRQTVELRVYDVAGNRSDTASTEINGFHSEVTISTNLFILWYNNRPLFWGSITGAAALLGGVIAALAVRAKEKRKSKKDEEV